MKFLRYFMWSIVVCLVGFVMAFGVGHWQALYITVLLALLEISLSFDNAVVNAKVLQFMPVIWRKRFLLWGILIAVFGVRLVLPVVLVALSAHVSLIRVVHMALDQPTAYAQLLEAAYPILSAFGGAFLLCVFFEFLLNGKRQVHWLSWLEGSLVVRWLSRLWFSPYVLVVMCGVALCLLLPKMEIMVAFGGGVLLHLVIHRACHFDEKQLEQAAKVGFLGFLYLEVLDASFSFDGVLGAFAMTSDVIIILIGLGIGAMFVRSLTIYMVDHQTLNRFLYLEHGAHYAIGFLGVVMLLKIFIHVPELITGTVGIMLILLALGHSLYAQSSNKRIG